MYIQMSVVEILDADTCCSRMRYGYGCQPHSQALEDWKWLVVSSIIPAADRADWHHLLYCTGLMSQVLGDPYLSRRRGSFCRSNCAKLDEGVRQTIR